MVERMTISVLSCHARRERGIRLAEQLGAQLVVDDSWQEGNLDAAMTAWSQHGRYGYHLVIQDDAIPIRGFRPSADAACRAADGAGVCFWMRPWHPDARAQRKARPGTLTPVSTYQHWPPTVALALPADVCDELVDHAARCHRADRYDDDVVGCFLWQEAISLVACSPSIVEHDDAEPSLLNKLRVPHLWHRSTYLAVEAPSRWRLA